MATSLRAVFRRGMESDATLWRGVLWMVAGSGAAQLLAAIAGLVLARQVGPEGYGLYTAAFALSSVFAYAASLGLDTIVPRQIARQPARLGTVARSALYPVLIWIFPLAFGIGGSGLLVGYAEEPQSLLWLAAWITGVRGVINLTRAVFRGIERMDRDALIQVLEGGLVLAGVALGLRIAPTVRSAILFTLLGETVTLALAGLWVRGVVGPARWEPALAWAMIREAFPLSLAFTLVGLSLRLDTLVLSLLQPAREVGIYGAAVGVVMLTRSLSTMAAAFLPRLSALAAQDHRAFVRLRDQTFRLAAAVGLGLGGGISLLAPLFIGWLYGPEFTEAVSPLRILGIMSAALFLNTYFWQVLIARGEHRVIIRSTTIAMLVSLPLAVLLIPRAGALGAAGVALFREVIQAVCMARPAMKN